MRMRLPACLLLVVCLLCAQQPLPTAAGDCRIEGRVVNASSGKPVRRANVVLNLLGPEAFPSTATTGADGRFVFDGLPPGGYMLRAERGGFIPQIYGSATGAGPAQPLRLAPGQVMKDILIQLVPQGVIEGKVLDDEGEPVSGAMVRAVAAPGGGAPGPGGMASSPSNDIGEFRLAGLAPGRYLVVVNPRRPPMQPVAPREDLLTTYYPAAADRAAAKTLEVRSGKETRKVTIRLRKGRVYRVQGRVVADSEKGVPAGLTIQLRPRPVDGTTGVLVGIGPGSVKADGMFEFASVEPGVYDLLAVRPGGPAVVVGRAPVEVADGDVTGVVLRLREPFRIAGTLRIEGPGGAGFPKTRVVLTPLAGMPSPTSSAAVAADGGFVLEDLRPDSYSVTVGPLPPGSYVKSVRIGTAETRGSLVDLSVAGPGAAMEIVVSPNGATIEGTVRGLPAAGPAGVVLLVPETSGAPSLARMIRAVVNNGRFVVHGVPPGEYSLYAFTEPFVRQDDDAGVLKPYEKGAFKLAVAEGDQRKVELTLLKR